MKKIMFNDKYGLTQAVLEGRKTQARRVAHLPDGATVLRPDLIKLKTGELRRPFVFSRYGRNEELAVAQSYKVAGLDPFESVSTVCAGINAMDVPGWDNKMFVRAELMPYSIKITNVRVERLQDISDEDCLKEGITSFKNKYGVDVYSIGKRSCFSTAKLAFAALVDNTCGKGTWENNPWVFVYEFELTK